MSWFTNAFICMTFCSKIITIHPGLHGLRNYVKYAILLELNILASNHCFNLLNDRIFFHSRESPNPEALYLRWQVLPSMDHKLQQYNFIDTRWFKDQQFKVFRDSCRFTEAFILLIRFLIVGSPRRLFIANFSDLNIFLEVKILYSAWDKSSTNSHLTLFCAFIPLYSSTIVLLYFVLRHDISDHFLVGSSTDRLSKSAASSII